MPNAYNHNQCIKHNFVCKQLIIVGKANRHIHQHHQKASNHRSFVRSLAHANTHINIRRKCTLLLHVSVFTCTFYINDIFSSSYMLKTLHRRYTIHTTSSSAALNSAHLSTSLFSVHSAHIMQYIPKCNYVLNGHIYIQRYTS